MARIFATGSTDGRGQMAARLRVADTTGSFSTHAGGACEGSAHCGGIGERCARTTSGASRPTRPSPWVNPSSR